MRSKEDNKPLVNNTINATTQIIFSIKGFFGTIAAILGIFFAFYGLVIIPKVNSTEIHYQIMFKDQKEQNRIFYNEISKLNNSIGSLNETINSLNNKFNELNQSIQNIETANNSLNNNNFNNTSMK
jgi:peptidoglycan hydrolase CwlO-like protein